MDREAWQATVHGVAKNQTRLSDFHFPTPQIHLVAQALEPLPLLGPLSGTLFLDMPLLKGFPWRRSSSACLQKTGLLAGIPCPLQVAPHPFDM